MPYTPPSHRSPASSAPPSPEVSRRSSFNSQTPTSPKPVLPRSASYLSRHRRTPSAGSTTSVTPSVTPRPSNGPTPDTTPPGTSDNLKGMVSSLATPVRQSPPPVADGQTMPPGAIISPPESSSEDEGTPEPEKRGREIENIKELKEAISAIPLHRAPSPVRSSPGDLFLLPSQAKSLIGESRQSMLTASLPALTTSARKISHSRSSTDSHIYMSKSEEISITTSEEGSEQDEPVKKPQMVRKKSGELVRPALRAQRRPSSMPGTPTFSKAVHFDSHLEHVRHFLQVDRPLAVSAGSSPVEAYESETEYPFGFEEKASPRSPPFEWELVVHKFPTDTPIRKTLPIRVERVWMSPDQKCLIGSVAVANLAFQKSVTCRFTFDYWKTTSEVAAEYHHEITRPRGAEVGHDRFQFSLKLSDFANLEAKTLFFCIRYNVNSLEYWDNNDGLNFQVDFRKKMLPINGKKGVQTAASRPANTLPRSNRRANPSTAARPKSMPVGALDDFGHDSKFSSFDKSLHEVLGESGPALRLKNSKSTSSLPSDNLPSRLSAPSGQAFANRYDFGASLNAAKQARRESSQYGDALYMKPNKKASESQANPARYVPSAPAASGPRAPITHGPAGPASASYEEILNKYCFVRTSRDRLASRRNGNHARRQEFNGSKQSSPQLKDGAMRTGRYDGVDSPSNGTNSSNSSSNGSPSVADQPRHLHHQDTAIHHSLRQNLGPYFANGYMPAIGGSPAESPLSQPPLSSPNSGTPKDKAASPGSMAGFFPLAGTGTSSIRPPADLAPFHAHFVQDRFPFAPETYTATAIRG
ncbi:carbohydrate-binding module family 21 protein [Annulohypoxylon maeteangense]|uniref:carbohydrate-binding module family 21 protein n=1 Tax=Annulohypoxylon maeteangense TaxID=1927788 RepID=UPI002007A84C|nr:carbohydrate-binding module family 21 protein [Annulohypoxylon maeteangense]KAI0883576.1 carbohydrate-binding module family 21 protein [Annulohypoxylon maeteangense]